MGGQPGDLAFLRGEGGRTGLTRLGGGPGGGEFIAGFLGPWGGTCALKVIEGGNQVGARLGLAAGASQPGSVQELGAGTFEGCLWSLERSEVVPFGFLAAGDMLTSIVESRPYDVTA